ncbi:MAG: RecQ family ATP-dependent DNA helicase [Lachnospirales bacterium]
MRNALKQIFGYDNFRYGQEEVVTNIYKGRDVFAIMPTGGGKSVCYQLPAILSEGITLVISPLVSLMADQVRQLKALGIRGAYLNSTLTFKQYLKALDNAKKGVYKIIYVAPERLENDDFIDFARNIDISIIAIDEAHCVSQWGQDFRPSYLRINNFVNNLPNRPTLCAFTATATAKVKEDVIIMLGLNNPLLVETGFDRPNLYFETRTPISKNSALLKVCKKHINESGIVYCISRKKVEEVCSFLCKNGYSATRYHAGLDDEERKKNQSDFIYDNKNIMVATNAFGMGINKSDVRYVVHYNMPKSLEFYYQEAGRAGRDGERAECYLFYEPQDYFTNKFLIEQIDESGEMPEEQRKKVIENELKKLGQMRHYTAMKDGCLRNYMLYYFGEKAPYKCNNCSNCLKNREIETYVKKDPVKVDYNLVALLKKVRAVLAKRYRTPAATLITDATIRDMAVKRPTSRDELKKITGFNAFKIRAYGDEFLKIIIAYEQGEL